MSNDFNTIVKNGLLIHTGSRVFYSHCTVDTDYDYFGFLSEDLLDELTRIGFEVHEKSKHGSITKSLKLDNLITRQGLEVHEKSKHGNRTKRLKLDNLDVFLFFREEDYNKYHKAHCIANEVMLRDALPDKEEFLKVFTLMTGYDSYE